MQSEIQNVVSAAEASDCVALLRELRPHLDVDSFLVRLEAKLRQGNRLTVLRRGDVEGPVALAGWRVHDSFSSGRRLCIDDLVTASSLRGRGYGGELMEFLVAAAKDEHCREIHLDSGYDRHSGHRFYLGQGFILQAHHFVLRLG